ncbi:L,D-transpeptidase family protein [Actinacidiphila sp. DG2A-62]|uniref:L,D-transpeptidase family protein n=1 Tax=Actinacidiphila sp. DG2A-62 TaxID=3108821 RepID=UPI003FA3484B
MRRTSRKATAAAAAATAALAAVVLTACGPQDTGAADDRAPTPARSAAADPAATTAGAPPTTSAPATPTAAPTTPRATPTATATTKAPAKTPAKTPAKAPTTPPVVPAVMAVGSNSAQVRELQARLGQLHLFSRTPTGYYGSVTQHAVSDFQERHALPSTGRVDATTWARVRALTRPPTHKEMYPPVAPRPAAKLDPRCMTGHAMCISKTTRTLSWVVDGKVLSTMDVRFGSQYTPTREGLFHVTFKSRNHVSTIYHTPMPYAMFFSGGEAVHYSADFAARGYAGASHGCVNVRDKAAIAALFDQVKDGDKVVVYW